MKSKETSKEITLEFDLSGFDKKDIKLHLSKNSISINAVKKEDHKEKKKEFFQEERSYKSFNYSAPLPKIIPKKSKISFDEGILKIVAKKE